MHRSVSVDVDRSVCFRKEIVCPVFFRYFTALWFYWHAFCCMIQQKLMQNHENMAILGFIGGIISFLGFVFLLVLVIVIIAGVAIRNYISRLFGGGKFASDSRSYDNNNEDANSSSRFSGRSNRSETKNKRTKNKKGKIFGKDEGKYVDFVEVKD